jgi:hypothetical protein
MKKMSLCWLSLLVCAGFLNAGQSPSRMDRSRLNIGTYYLQPYASSEAHIKDLADCGIDFVVCMRNEQPTLDLFYKYHVGAFVSKAVPGWWGGRGANAGTMEKKNPLSVYETALAKFQNHPAIWGIDIGDEPSALDFPHYGRVASMVNKSCPDQIAYMNLYPNYGAIATNTAQDVIDQLGTATYEEHIAAYCKHVPLDYLSYDFYMYSITVPKAYENLRVVSDACLGTGRSMWIVLQVNSNNPEKWISENQLRFQAYTAMAFGAENIVWACYTAGWWHNQVVDKNGQKTQQYEKLKTVNREIHNLGAEYMRYRRVATHFIGYDGTPWLEGVKQSSKNALDNGFFQAVRSQDDTPCVIGTMVSRSGDSTYAMFVCIADDPLDQAPKDHKLLFRADGRSVKVFGGSGEIKVSRLEDGSYSVPVRSNAGVLVTAK